MSLSHCLAQSLARMWAEGTVLSIDRYLANDQSFASLNLDRRRFRKFDPTLPHKLAYDRAVAAADPSDVHTSKKRTSTRINDFVNRGSEFDSIYIYPPLLSACCQIIGSPFKLSGMRARTLHAGAPAEGLHVDVKHQADGWPLVGCILMVDAFTAENGATRFVPGTHLQSREPGEVMKNPSDDHPEQVLACGPVGSIVIFDASAWHGYTANKSNIPRLQ
jgi:hypothetical protein